MSGCTIRMAMLGWPDDSLSLTARYNSKQEPAAAHPMTSPRSLSLLIVEDEALIRMMLSDMLDELGHRVAAHAALVPEALKLIDGGLQFDGAILDLNLGGETAEPVADAIAHKDIPFIFASGYGSAGIPDRFRGTPFVRKPYSLTTLSEGLQSMM